VPRKVPSGTSLESDGVIDSFIVSEKGIYNGDGEFGWKGWKALSRASESPPIVGVCCFCVLAFAYFLLRSLGVICFGVLFFVIICLAYALPMDMSGHVDGLENSFSLLSRTRPGGR
jgi:hypothetical protein